MTHAVTIRKNHVGVRCTDTSGKPRSIACENLTEGLRVALWLDMLTSPTPNSGAARENKRWMDAARAHMKAGLASPFWAAGKKARHALKPEA